MVRKAGNSFVDELISGALGVRTVDEPLRRTVAVTSGGEPDSEPGPPIHSGGVHPDILPLHAVNPRDAVLESGVCHAARTSHGVAQRIADATVAAEFV